MEFLVIDTQAKSDSSVTIPFGITTGFLVQLANNHVRAKHLLHKPHRHALAMLAGGLAGYLYSRAYNSQLELYQTLLDQRKEKLAKEKEIIEKYASQNSEEQEAH